MTGTNQGYVSEEHKRALEIAIPIFIGVNALLAVIGTIQTRRLSHKTSEDVLTAHFLGGRSFGSVVLFGTMFASLFSGGTVVGIPEEAYGTGWITMRNIIYHPFFIYVFAGIAPRMRKASMVRNHTTPVDFITDFYRSQLLRYTIAFTQVLSQFIWMCSNVVALKNAFNGAFGLDPDYPWITVAIVAFILVSEWFGGLNAVALTDCVQGFIMVLGSLSVTCVIKKNFGGWTALDPYTFPRPEFYQTPSRRQQWDFWQEGFLQAGAIFFPVQIQRLYAAADLKGVRMAAVACFVGPWAAQFGSVFLGIMGVQILGNSCPPVGDPEHESCMNPASPFAATLDVLMSMGGFPEVAAVILYTSALAAIMSTTDSVLISISQIFTTEVVYPLKPGATPNQVNWMGRIVSTIVAILALITGLTWKGSIILLFQMNEPFSMQLFPSFMLGLYSPYVVHPWSLAFGCFAGFLATIIIEIMKTNIQALNDYALRPGISTFIINCVSIIVSEAARHLWVRVKGERQIDMSSGEEEVNNVSNHRTALDDGEVDDYVENPVQETAITADLLFDEPFKSRPAWDKVKALRFGTPYALTPKLLNRMMESSGPKNKELFKNVYYAALVILGITLSTPLTPEFMPTLIGPDTEFYTIRGIPWWAFKMIILIFLAFLLTVPMLYFMPSDLGADDEKLFRSGIDAEAVELEPEEKGGRMVYDEFNSAAFRRRSVIRSQTARIMEVNSLAEQRAAEITAGADGVDTARSELRRLVSSKKVLVAKNFLSNKKLSDVAEVEEEGQEGKNELTKVD